MQFILPLHGSAVSCDISACLSVSLLKKTKNCWIQIWKRKKIYARKHKSSVHKEWTETHTWPDWSVVRTDSKLFYHTMLLFWNCFIRKVDRPKEEISYLHFFGTVVGAEAAEHWERQRGAIQHVLNVQHTDTHTRGCFRAPEALWVNMHQTSNSHRENKLCLHSEPNLHRDPLLSQAEH